MQAQGNGGKQLMMTMMIESEEDRDEETTDWAFHGGSGSAAAEVWLKRDREDSACSKGIEQTLRRHHFGADAAGSSPAMGGSRRQRNQLRLEERFVRLTLTSFS
jgi:hypothetical protein